jgi:hypothetical protein
LKTKTHRSRTRTNYKRNINITFYPFHSWFLPQKWPRILNRNNNMTLQLVDDKPLVSYGERHSSNLSRWLNTVIPDLVISVTKCTKITMLLSLPSHCPRFWTLQTPCPPLFRVGSLQYAITMMNLLTTNTLRLLHIQNNTWISSSTSISHTGHLKHFDIWKV